MANPETSEATEKLVEKEELIEELKAKPTVNKSGEGTARRS